MLDFMDEQTVADCDNSHQTRTGRRMPAVLDTKANTTATAKLGPLYLAMGRSGARGDDEAPSACFPMLFLVAYA